MSDTFNNLSDEHLKAIADGKFDSLPDDVLKQIAGGPTVAPVQSAKPNPYAGASRAELLAAQQGIIDNDPESFKSKAGMFGRALGSATLKIGLPAAAVTLAPVTGGGSLAALGAVSGIAGEYLGNKVAGEDTTPGGLASAGIVNALPGGSLVNAGLGQVAKQGAKYALTNVAAKEAQSLLDTGAPASVGDLGTAAALGFGGAPLSRVMGGMSNRATDVARLASQDADRTATMQMGKELGYKLPIGATNPNFGNDVITRLGGGKAVVAQEAVLNNQLATNAAARRVLDIPDHVGIDEKVINQAKVAPNMVYEKVGSVSPDAKELLGHFKQYSADENALFSQYKNNHDPATLAAAQQARGNADAAYSLLSEEVKAAGHKTLMDDFAAARKQLGQINLIQRSYVPGTGNIDASVAGDELANEIAQFGKTRITGDLYKVARFENAFGRYVREASKQPQMGGDFLKMMTLPLVPVEYGARAAAFSKLGQRRALPSYGTATEDLPAQLGRRGAMQLSR